jgi:hypothetical protein
MAFTVRLALSLALVAMAGWAGEAQVCSDEAARARNLELFPDAYGARVPVTEEWPMVRLGKDGVWAPLDESRSPKGPLDPGEILGERAEQGVAACPWDLVAKVRAEAGNDCLALSPNVYRAEIAAFSGRCVPQCNNARRLAEANAAAQAECAAFCSGKGCPISIYSVSPRCAADDCYASAACPAACPQRDYCALLQGQAVWNCHCNVPLPLLPDVEG